MSAVVRVIRKQYDSASPSTPTASRRTERMLKHQQALITQSGLGIGSRMLIAKDPRFDAMDVRTRYVLAGPVKQNGIEISRSH